MFEIGNSLREARLRQQLDFPELEQQTKIRSKYLKALEDEKFELLPAPTYVKGFLRNYADALGLEGQLYVDEYNSRFVTGEEDIPLRPRDYQRRPPSMGPRFETRAILLVLGGIAVVFALVIVAAKFGSSPSPRVPNLNSSAPNVPRTTHKRQHRRAPAPAPKAHLVLTAVTGNCWLLVRAGSASGRQLYEGTLPQGQQLPFTQGRYLVKRLWISAGAPWNLVARVNGKVLAVPKTHGVSEHLIVTPTSITKAPPGT
jgi:cytoskeleton protein RodZ